MEALDDPRTRLAAERTLLAWIRTGLALMGFGFVVARFGLFLRELAAVGHLSSGHSLGLSLWLGIAAVLMGVVVNLVAAWEHAQLLKTLAGTMPSKRSYSLGVVIAIVLSLLGVVLVAYLLLLRG